MTAVIRREEPGDHDAVEALVREAFWNVYRPGCCEHLIVHRGRSDAALVPELNLVMESGGELIGQIIYFGSRILFDGGGEKPCLIFGPISIAPARQRQGYGRQLLDYSLERAAALGWDCVCIEGSIGFHGRSGFVVAGGQGIRKYGEAPGTVSPHFLLRELVRGALYGLTGQFVVPDVYSVDEADAAAFDSRFPPKERLRLPGQLE